MIIRAVSVLAPPHVALLPHAVGPYLALMLCGFGIGILGHLTRARWLIAAGVILIMISALLFPLGVSVSTENNPSPIEAPP